MLIQRITFRPAHGKTEDLRRLLEERARSRQGEGTRVMLAQRLVSHEGPVFVLTIPHDDAAAWEQDRQRTLGTPAWEAWQAKLTPLLKEAPTGELLDVLVPFQPQ
jgi:hypothetical protein